MADQFLADWSIGNESVNIVVQAFDDLVRRKIHGVVCHHTVTGLLTVIFSRVLFQLEISSYIFVLQLDLILVVAHRRSWLS
jgi:hypothetical protein